MPQLSQYELFVDQKKREQLQELEFEKQQNERVKIGQPRIESDATRLVSDFRPASPPPDYVAKNQSIYSDDDEADDELELLEEYFLEYKDRFESNDEKDTQKTTINVKEPTNNFILKNEKKKSKENL